MVAVVLTSWQWKCDCPLYEEPYRQKCVSFLWYLMLGGNESPGVYGELSQPILYLHGHEIPNTFDSLDYGTMFQ